MAFKLFDRILGGQDELDREKDVADQENDSVDKNWKEIKINWLELLFIFLMAITPRLLYMFVFSNPNIPGFYTDVFHHWQIAFLSKEIGFHQSFLRLWDFKGMEFFWGLLHPMVLVLIMDITGSVSILIPRLLSVFGGSVSIVLVFLIIKRYFNSKAAWAVAIFMCFFPITLFSNTMGMQEELAAPFVFGAIYLWPKKPVVSGIFLALASMVRAEYWLFSFGLVLAAVLLRKNINKVAALAASYFVIILIYMKYLADYTGNYIYPIYWNFLASVKGEWFANLPVIGEKLMAEWISRGIFAFGAIGIILTLIKRPRHALFYFFGFGNILFIGFMVGFGSYVKGYITRFWIDRLYNWPYVFTAILLILAMFFYLPKKFKFVDKLKINWIILVAGLAVSQLIWKPINFNVKLAIAGYNGEKVVATEISNYYHGGGILLPEDHPFITYFLAHDYKVPGKEMVGEMFDPFYYFKDQSNLFSNWGEDRVTVLNWLKKNDIKLIVLTQDKPSYDGLIQREPQLFNKLPSKNVILYEVKN